MDRGSNAAGLCPRAPKLARGGAVRPRVGGLRLGRLPTTVLLLPLLAATACSPDAPSPDPPLQDEGAESAASGDEPEQIHERRFVFLVTEADSSIVVPWFFSARTRADGVEREARGWLARSEAWEPFFSDRWETPPTRAPWRIHPRWPMRLIVGEGDVVEAIVYEESPARQLEVVIGAARAEWSGSRGEAYRIRDAHLLLSERAVAGTVFDMTRAREAASTPPGDWAFLTSGDSLQLVLSNPRLLEPEPPEGHSFRGWARRGEETLEWSDLTVTWPAVRSFDDARRNIPSSWEVRSASGDLRSDLRAGGAHLAVGEGEDPVLPVKALFLVSGVVRIGRANYPVTGLFRHIRP